MRTNKFKLLLQLALGVFFGTLVLGSASFAQTSTPTPVLSAVTPNVPAIGQADAADVSATFSVATGGSFAFATGAYVNLVKIPKGAVITDFYIYVPDIDSASSLVIDVGTSASPELLVADSTVGRSAGVLSVTSTGAAQFPLSVFTSDAIIRLSASTGQAGTGAGGTLQGWVRYNMRGNAF